MQDLMRGHLRVGLSDIPLGVFLGAGTCKITVLVSYFP